MIEHIKKHIFELSAGGVGFTSTIVIDWKHIAERAIETMITASINGAVAAAAGYLAVYLLKKLLNK